MISHHATASLAALGGLLLLAACSRAPVQTSHAPPASTDPFWSSNRELEPPNALPPGFTTNHPLTPATGNLKTTREP